MAAFLKKRIRRFLKFSFVFALVFLWIYAGRPRFFNFPPGVQPVGAAQYGRPASDISTGSWTTTPLWSKIDESPYDDADYVTSSRNPSSDTFEVSLSGITDPQSSLGHIIRYRASTSNQAGTMAVYLIQGTTQIASSSNTGLTTSFASYSFTLTAGEADSITNYADLRLRFVSTGAGNTFHYVSWAEFEAPDAPSLDITAPGSVQMPDYQLGGVGYTERNFNDVSALVQVTASAGFTVTVSSTNLTSANNTISSADVRLRTDGTAGTNPTIIENCSGFSGVTETSSGEYALNTAQTIMTAASGSGTCDIYPTIRVYIDPSMRAEESSGTLTFTVY